ncbi:MAG: hypothetical protein M0Q95_20810 [Porticoccaceae bacterium]|nr:hypothetical protein [Porticoccaceae bacterium]
MSGPNSYSKTYSYDASYGHNTSVSETIAGTAYVTDMTYDSKGRLDKLKYPGPSNRLEIQHLYNVRGYLTTVRNAATSLNYYTATAMDARGNVTAETHGNGLTTSRVYQANTGYLQSVRVIPPFLTAVKSRG